MTQPTSTKCSHYVSLENNAIYPAMASPAGYEDDHPTEWRAATRAEIDKYLAGGDTVVERPLPLSINELAATSASPTKIELGGDDETEATPSIPAAPVIPAPPKV